VTFDWRTHPKLQGKFHPDYPDDVRVIVHDGGPRLTDRQPELMWVRVTGYSPPVFTGLVLNRPEQLRSVSEGDEISFMVPDRGEHAIRVSAKYLAERPNWTITPCPKCGLSELFDAPSDLTNVVFASLPPGATMEVFTAVCGLCGGVQMVQHRDAFTGESSIPPVKRWWQFWK